MSEDQKCDRVAVYTANVAGVALTYKAPLRVGVMAPESVFRGGNFLSLTAILTSEDVPVGATPTLSSTPQ